MDKFNFYVDEEKRTVVATLFVDEDCVVDEMVNILRKSVFSEIFIPHIEYNPNLLVKGKYVGKAYCHPNDTFNVETGIELARMKAIKAYLHEQSGSIRRSGTQFIKHLATFLSGSLDFVGYLDKLVPEESVININLKKVFEACEKKMDEDPEWMPF